MSQLRNKPRLGWSVLAAVFASLAMTPAQTNANEAPKRVVSMNLCTDQLAMMLAAPDQLHSVTYLALNPRASAMVEEAQHYVINHGLAEEIYLMEPDLVIAGAFSTRATVAMLRRLDIPVVVFDPAFNLEEVAARITQMGEVLHQGKAAAEMRNEFETRLADLQGQDQEGLRAVLYFANGYTSGEQTLAGQILAAAGFTNAAIEQGYTGGGTLPLELLALTDPDVIVTSQRQPGASRAEEVLAHPVVNALRQTKDSASLTDHDWVCGTPYVLRAIDELLQLSRVLTKDAP